MWEGIRAMSKTASGAGVGASSIMLIIVVVCLTLFGVLSYVTARNDAVLSGRTLESVQRYYEADAEAQRALMAIDEWIAGGMQGQPDGLALEPGDDGTLSFAVAAEGAHALRVVLRVEDGGYIIERYSYENTGAWSADTTEDLYG